jgi:hypothetical protein
MQGRLQITRDSSVPNEILLEKPHACHCDERSEEAIPTFDRVGGWNREYSWRCHRESSWRRFASLAVT